VGSVQELPEVSVSDDGDIRYLHLGTPWVQGSMRIRDPLISTWNMCSA
jgi:hypothetical protein